MFYKITFKGHECIVYDTQDIVKTWCDAVNGYGVEPEEIQIETIGRANEREVEK